MLAILANCALFAGSKLKPSVKSCQSSRIFGGDKNQHDQKVVECCQSFGIALTHTLIKAWCFVIGPRSAVSFSRMDRSVTVSKSRVGSLW